MAEAFADIHVLVTRPGASGSELTTRLEELGATVTLAPAIRVETSSDSPPAIEAREILGDVDRVVFTSRFGVHGLLGEERAPAGAPPACCVGPSTAGAATDRGFEIEFSIERGGVATLVAELATRDLAGTRLLWPRGDLAEAAALAPLTAAGAEVTDRVVYRTVTPDEFTASKLPAASNLDVVVCASPSAIGSVLGVLEGARELPFVTIGETTGDAARDAGIANVHAAETPGNAGLVATLLEHFGQ